MSKNGGARDFPNVPSLRDRWLDKVIDRLSWQSFLLGFVGVAGSLASILSFIVPIHSESGKVDFGYAVQYVLYMNIFLVIALGISIYLFLHRSRVIRRFKREEFREQIKYGVVSRCLEAIQAKGIEATVRIFELSNEIHDIDACSRGDGVYSKEVMAKYEGLIHDASQFIVDNIVDALKSLTGHNCSVSIKVFFGGDGGVRRVYTYARDSLSSYERSKTDRKLDGYVYSDNSAFEDIQNPSKPDYFLCNDLTGLGNGYRNSNPDWRMYYNATIVVPIKAPNSIDGIDTVGFLCVDNKGGGFDDQFSVKLLSSLAYLLYSIIGLFSYELFTECVGRSRSYE